MSFSPTYYNVASFYATSIGEPDQMPWRGLVLTAWLISSRCESEGFLDAFRFFFKQYGTPCLHPVWYWPRVSRKVFAKPLICQISKLLVKLSAPINSTNIVLKKNLNASRPSEHSQSGGEMFKTFRWDHRLQIIQNLYMAFKRAHSPMV